jgi:hypothetical protein
MCSTTARRTNSTTTAVLSLVDPAVAFDAVFGGRASTVFADVPGPSGPAGDRQKKIDDGSQALTPRCLVYQARSSTRPMDSA